MRAYGEETAGTYRLAMLHGLFVIGVRREVDRATDRISQVRRRVVGKNRVRARLNDKIICIIIYKNIIEYFTHRMPHSLCASKPPATPLRHSMIVRKKNTLPQLMLTKERKEGNSLQQCLPV